VLLSLGFFLLVYWLAAAAAGPADYQSAVGILGSPPLQLVLFGAVFSFCYHLLNGVRHLFFDLGHGFELKTARASGWAVAIGALLLGLVLWLVLRAGLGGAP
jgi:succinate dehydrogenase / fumarate reductase cytochrome b subunit